MIYRSRAYISLNIFKYLQIVQHPHGSNNQIHRRIQTEVNSESPKEVVLYRDAILVFSISLFESFVGGNAKFPAK